MSDNLTDSDRKLFEQTSTSGAHHTNPINAAIDNLTAAYKRRINLLEETNQALRMRLERYEQQAKQAQPPAIVHCVYAGKYEDRWLVAIYVNEEDAKAHAATIDKSEDPDVLEETLHTCRPKGLVEGLHGFKVSGKVKDKRTWAAEPQAVSDEYFWYGEGRTYHYPASVGPSHGNPLKDPDTFIWRGWALNNAHAKQLATVALSNHEHKTGCHPIEQKFGGREYTAIEDDGEPQ